MLIGLLLLAALPLTALGSWNRRRARIAVTLAGLSLGNQVALLALFPPRFRVPQTDQENYLGFNLPSPPMLPELLGPGRPNLLLATVALTAIVLYLLGWLRLRRGGISGPWSAPSAGPSAGCSSATPPPAGCGSTARRCSATTCWSTSP